MKIYILPVSKEFQPISQPFAYPLHNKDWGVEQDFHQYLLQEPSFCVPSPGKADWHYLPIYWSRYHLNHDYGKSGLEELQREIDRTLIDEDKTFTICQYARGPLVNLGHATVFLGSRKIEEGFDIPLLSSPHSKPLLYRLPFLRPPQKYLASFVGRLSTHPIRKAMREKVGARRDIYIYDGIKDSKFFVKKMLDAHIALCPRGVGGDSFRFYEAMQLGVVPFLIGDIDTRPFKKFIDWEAVSFYRNSVSDISRFLNNQEKSELLQMGRKAAALWREKLTYQKWCKYVLLELEDRK